MIFKIFSVQDLFLMLYLVGFFYVNNLGVIVIEYNKKKFMWIRREV